MAGCSPQGLSQLAWAHAKLGLAAPQLLDAIAHEAAPRLREFSPHELVNLAWAYAMLEHQSAYLLGALAGHARSRLHQFTPQELAKTALSYATLATPRGNFVTRSPMPHLSRENRPSSVPLAAP